MKKVLIAILLLAPSLALAETHANPADYPISIHVQSSRLCCGNTLDLMVVIDGKKYELSYSQEIPQSKVLRVGDYKARIVKDTTAEPYMDQQTYELLFPDGSTRKFNLVGESE